MIDQRIVKNVILDLGGVLVDIDPQQTIDAFQRIIKPSSFETIDWRVTPEAVFSMETGKWSKKQFYGHFKSICRCDIIEEEIVDAWNAMLLEFPTKRVDMLKKLAERYSLYLLSNTNVFHIKCFETDFKNRYHYSLKKLFTNVYYSSEIWFRKPDADCFRYVLNDAAIKPEETILVDDLQENCLAAEAIGIRSIKVPEKSGLEAVIHQLL